jgi:hypothetical protein
LRSSWLLRRIRFEGAITQAAVLLPCLPARHGTGLATRTQIARHDLFCSGAVGKERSLPAHSPGRDHAHKRELLKQRFAEFGACGERFFEELVRTRRNSKDEATRVLAMLTVYHRVDLASALERAVRYRAFSRSAVERILAAHAKPRTATEALLSEAREQRDEMLRQTPLAPSSTAEYQSLLEGKGDL